MDKEAVRGLATLDQIREEQYRQMQKIPLAKRESSSEEVCRLISLVGVEGAATIVAAHPLQGPIMLALYHNFVLETIYREEVENSTKTEEA